MVVRLTGSAGAARLRVVPDSPEPGLVGRAECLDAIGAVLAAAFRGVGRALVVRGPAGIGKTALLAGVMARAEGMLVLRARGLESEAQLAYSGLFDLCRPLLDRLDRLGAPQAAALRSALALAPPSGQDQLATSVALLDLLTMVAAETPVLVLVDDGQWLDTATAGALSFVARRLHDASIAFVVAVRDDPDHDPRYEGIEDMVLVGLSDDDSARLLAQHARGVVAEPVVAKLVALSEGNPLALIEVAALLSPEQLAGRVPLPAQLPVGSRLSGVFDGRVSGLPQNAARSTGIAALWEGSLSALSNAAIEGFDPAHLQLAAGAGLLTIAGDHAAFRHPLARSAAIRVLTPPELRGAHRAMAALLEDEQELRAWHLASAADGPDEPAAEALTRAAAVAAGRGALAGAADMLERAAELTADADARGARLVDAGSLAAQSGAIQRAVDLCARAREVITDPLIRGRLQHLWGGLATSGTMSVPAGIELLQADFDRMTPLDPDLAVRIGIDICLLAVQAGDQALAVDIASRTCTVAERAAQSAKGLAGFTLASARAFANECPDGDRLVRDHADLLAEHPTFNDLTAATAVAVVGLTSGEKYASARVIADGFAAAARSRGAIGALPLVLALAAKAALLMDEWAPAEAIAEEALHLAREGGQLWGAQYAAAWLALLAALRGREDVVQAWSADVVGWSGVIGTTPGHAIVCHSLGLLALGYGRNEEAVAHFDALARLRSGQKATSDGLLHWEGDYIEALIRSGRIAEAQAQLGRLEGRPLRSSNPWMKVVAARCRALMADESAIDEVFTEAVDADPQLSLPFERLRSELCWGERLLGAGRHQSAAAHLRSALVGFDGFGATSWTLRARLALLRTEDTAGLVGGVAVATSGLGSVRSAAGPTSSKHAALEHTVQPMLVTLGDFLVKNGGEDVRLFGHVGRAVGFVAARGGSVHIDELIDALWPDATADVGRARLRNVLSRSRHATNALLVRDGDVVRIADGVKVDLASFEDLAIEALRRASAGEPAAADTAREALAHHRGEFIASNRYDAWMTPVRDRVERRRRALLDLLAGWSESRGEIDEMLAYLELAIQSDPDDEARYVRAAVSLASLGRYGPALRFVERAERVMASLRLRPGAELVALRAQLTEPS